jgi:flagellar biosynthesis regulator FlbT
MALKITLKPFEQIAIGSTTLTNGCEEDVTFTISGSAPVLRQSNMMHAACADSHLKQAYLCLQYLYLERGEATLEMYRHIAARVLRQMPHVEAEIRQADRAVADGRLYAALRHYRHLLTAAGEGPETWSAAAGPSNAAGRAAPPAYSASGIRDRECYRQRKTSEGRSSRPFELAASPANA